MAVMVFWRSPWSTLRCVGVWLGFVGVGFSPRSLRIAVCDTYYLGGVTHLSIGVRGSKMGTYILECHPPALVRRYIS